MAVGRKAHTVTLQPLDTRISAKLTNPLNQYKSRFYNIIDPFHNNNSSSGEQPEHCKFVNHEL